MSSKVKSQVKVKKSNSISGSDDESEHELFHYSKDRVKLMKEVLKLIKPKQIKAIAPDFMKDLDMEEINSLLLEELLGISNKRLKRILNGVNVDDDSSTDSDGDKEPIDIISLDDISDEEDDFESENSGGKKSKGSKTKNSKSKNNKLKKKSKDVDVKIETTGEKEKLMSVLEILELQARARAIRSQLALENINKTTEPKPVSVESDESETDDVIVEVLKNEEIVISSSDSENEKVDSKEKSLENKVVNKNKDNREVETIQTVDNTEKESRNEETNKKSEKLNSSKKEEEITLCQPGQDEQSNINKDESENSVVEKDDHDDAVIINLDAIEIAEIEK